MSIQVVLVHGIRTSRTMWRAQVEHLTERGVPVTAVDLPGHGTRMQESFSLDAAMSTLDDAVQDAAARGPVLLAGHSLGGLLSIAYVGADTPPPVAGFIGASCTALPGRVGLAGYRLLSRAYTSLPDQGQWITRKVLTATLPDETRADFAAGGYAFAAQDVALASLSRLNLLEDVHRISVPLWWLNGQFDQLRTHERLFRRLTPHSELIVVPRTTHLVTAMRPRVFNALLDVAVATLERNVQGPGHEHEGVTQTW